MRKYEVLTTELETFDFEADNYFIKDEFVTFEVQRGGKEDPIASFPTKLIKRIQEKDRLELTKKG